MSHWFSPSEQLMANSCAKKYFAVALLASGFFSTGMAFGQGVTDVVLNIHPTPIMGPASSAFVVSFDVSNTTPVSAENVRLTASFSPIPTTGSVALVGALPSGCSGTGASLSCDLGTVASRSHQTITVTYTLAGAVGSWTLSGAVTTTTAESNTANNRVSTLFNTTESADLALSVGIIGSLVAGQSFVYPLTITNHGPSGISSGKTVVTFTVPELIRFTGAGGWSCAPSSADAGTEVACAHSGAISNGGTKTLNINATAMAGSPGAIDTSFHVEQQGSWPDTDLSNNTVTASVQIISGSDVGVKKTVETVEADRLLYTITPRFWAGDSLAEVSITVIDRYGRDQFTFDHWVSTGDWDCSEPVAEGSDMVLTCTRPGFDGEPFTDMPVIQFLATPNNPTAATNLASIALTDRDDPVTSNNDVSVTIDTSGEADLSASKVASFTPVIVDQIFDYNISAYNDGPWGIPAGQAITIRDPLPKNFVLVSPPQPASAYWSCVTTQNGDAIPDDGYPAASTTDQPIIVQCNSVGGLGVSASTPKVTLTVQVTDAESAANVACVSLAPRGSNSGWRQDTNAANDCSDPEGGVSFTKEKADVVVTKTVDKTTVEAAEELKYTITVSNRGPDEATNVIVTDAVTSLFSKGGLVSLSVTDGEGECTVDGNVPSAYPINGTAHNLQCTLASLPNGQSATIEVGVLPVIATTGARTNTVTAYSSDVGDPNRDNNIATAESTINAVFDLTVETWATSVGSSGATSAPVNSIITFTTRIESVGPSSTPDAKAVITLPDNAVFLGLSYAGGTCTPSSADLVNTTGQTLECVWRGGIPSNYHSDVTYQVMAPKMADVTVTSKAVVGLLQTGAGIQNETDLTNNSAQVDVVTIPASADLQVTIKETPDPAKPGNDVAYTITIRNNGPSLATDVALDVLFEKADAAYSYQDTLTVDQGGACSPPEVGALTGQTVCRWDTLAIGDSAVITYQMRAESIAAGNQSGSITTTAKVSSTEEDPAPDNNTAVKASTVSRDELLPPGADLAITKTASKDRVNVGETFHYEITVTNNGPQEVAVGQGAQIVDVLPVGLSLTAEPPGCSYDGAVRTLTCLIGDLAVGAQFTITASAQTTVGNGATIENTAIVDMPGDADDSNNQATASIVSGAIFSDATAVPAMSPLGLLLLALSVGGVVAVRRRA